MAFLPQEPRKQMMILIAILAIGAGAAYFNYVHRPAGEAIIETTDRIEDLETQNQIAETRIGNLQELRDRLAQAERQLQVLQRLVPAGSEVPEIFAAVATESQALNLQLISIDPLDPVPADSLGTLLRQEWLMVVKGEYHAIGQFFTRVASFDRIVRPHLTQLEPAGETAGGRQLVMAEFGLETFVLGDGNQTVASDGGGLVGGTEE